MFASVEAGISGSQENLYPQREDKHSSFPGKQRNDKRLVVLHIYNFLSEFPALDPVLHK